MILLSSFLEKTLERAGTSLLRAASGRGRMLVTDYVLNAEHGEYRLTGYDVRLLIHQRAALTKHTQTLARLCATGR